MPTALSIPAPYPLAWPPHLPRTHRRENDRYEVRDVGAAVAGVEREVNRWGSTKTRITNWELTTNISGRARGNPDDPGAAFWFEMSSGDATLGQDLMVLACDRFMRVAQNIRAISLTMERLRLVDEIGAYSLVNAVAGAKALPPPAAVVVDRPWRDVLGVGASAPLYVAEAAYRALAKAAGEGSPNLVDFNRAIAEAREVLR